jgi:hypothetical protein
MVESSETQNPIRSPRRPRVMAKQPEDRKQKQPKQGPSTVTSAKAWKKAGDAKPQPLEVPSGNTCLVRPVGMQAFMSEGLIPNSLMGIIQASMEAGEKGEEVDEDKVVEGFIADIRSDPSKLQDMIRMADACTVYCVLEPRVLPVPAADEERNPDLLYVDEVDLDDKLFLMNFAVGGTRDLEPFRERLSKGVESVSPSEELG